MNEIHSNGLLKGPAAFALLRLRYRCTTVELVILGITFTLSASHVPQSWLTNTLVAGILIAGIPVVVLINWSAVKVRAERKAGYTTLRNELKDLEQRDPYLGRVIRKPGQEYLKRADFLAIIQAAKEDAERLPQPAGATISTSSPKGGE